MWRGRIDLSHELPAGVTQVGDVVLSPDPLQFSGRVVDAVGRPIEGADIWFATRAEGETEWRTRYGPRVRTDADGRFAFFDALEGAGRRAWAVADGYEDDGPYEFVGGDSDARFVLARSGDGDD